MLQHLKENPFPISLQPEPDTDPDKKNRCQKCTITWLTGDRGGHDGHTAYLRRKFGINARNLVVTAPDGDQAGYDAGTPTEGPVTRVYEVKTGYAKLANDVWTSRESQLFFNNTFQFYQQAKVAAKCDLAYQIVFSNQAGYLGHYANLPPELQQYMQWLPW